MFLRKRSELFVFVRIQFSLYVLGVVTVHERHSPLLDSIS